jgi:hypothetical protein
MADSKEEWQGISDHSDNKQPAESPKPVNSAKFSLQRRPNLTHPTIDLISTAATSGLIKTQGKKKHGRPAATAKKKAVSKEWAAETRKRRKGMTKEEIEADKRRILVSYS